jgi:small-conductance mechanosensitive channel
LPTITISSDFLTSILESIVILAITYALDFSFGRIVLRAIGRKSRHSAYEIARIGSIVIWIGGILSILPLLGASDVVVAVVILLVGAFLIIVTKDFASNWFSGQMIRTIAPFRVGDWIKTSGGQYGRVTRIEGLFTILVTQQNETVVIPNSKLTSDLIVDRTTSGSLKVPVDLQVNPQVEFGELTLAVSKIAKELSPYLSDQGARKAEPEIYVLSRTPEFVKVRVFIKIDNVAKEEEVASEFRKRFALMGYDVLESDKEIRRKDELSGGGAIER